jgi:hypothetical protein
MYSLDCIPKEAGTFYLLNCICKVSGLCWLKCICRAQSRQSAKRFSSRWNWNSPTPLAAGECAPPPFGTGGGEGTLACG